MLTSSAVSNLTLKFNLSRYYCFKLIFVAKQFHWKYKTTEVFLSLRSRSYYLCVFQSRWSVHPELQLGFNTQTSRQEHRWNAGRVSADCFHLQCDVLPLWLHKVKAIQEVFFFCYLFVTNWNLKTCSLTSWLVAIFSLQQVSLSSSQEPPISLSENIHLSLATVGCALE